MHRSLAIVALVGFFSLPLPASAQEPGSPRVDDGLEPAPPVSRAAPAGLSALDAYLSRSMELRFEQGMFSSFDVYRNGAPIELGFFGGGYEEIFHGSPDAIESMSTYQILRAIGFPLWMAGTVLLTVELVIILVDTFENTDILINPSGPKPAFYGLLIGGAVSGLIGGTMMQAAPSYLNDAVLYYNRDLIMELRGQRAELPSSRGLKFAFSF